MRRALYRAKEETDAIAKLEATGLVQVMKKKKPSTVELLLGIWLQEGRGLQLLFARAGEYGPGECCTKALAETARSVKVEPDLMFKSLKIRRGERLAHCKGRPAVWQEL